MDAGRSLGLFGWSLPEGGSERAAAAAARPQLGGLVYEDRAPAGIQIRTLAPLGASKAETLNRLEDPGFSGVLGRFGLHQLEGVAQLLLQRVSDGM